jgi:hypothetical protein
MVPVSRRAMRSATSRYVVVLGALLSAYAPASAVAAASQGGAGATILNGLSVIKEADLDFGLVIPGSSAANVTVGLSGQRQCDQAITCLGSVSAARFTIHGRARERVSISLDRAVVTLFNGADQSVNATLSLSTHSVWLAAGSGSVTVGGRLRVRRQQATGAYRGTFSIIASYD